MLGVQSLFQNKVLIRAREYGLMPGQSKIIDYLGEHDGSNLTEIAEGCYLSNATISGIIDRMEKSGLIERRQKSGNRRAYFIYLTEKGRDAFEFLSVVFAELEEEVWRGVDAEESDRFIATLQKIKSNLEEQ